MIINQIMNVRSRNMKATFVCIKKTPSSNHRRFKPLQDFTSLQKTDEGFEGTQLTSFARKMRLQNFSKKQAGGLYLSYYFLLLVVFFSPCVFGVGEVEIIDFATWKIASAKEAKIMPNLISFNSTMSSCEKGRTWQVALQLLRDT